MAPDLLSVQCYCFEPVIGRGQSTAHVCTVPASRLGIDDGEQISIPIENKDGRQNDFAFNLGSDVLPKIVHIVSVGRKELGKIVKTQFALYR